MCFSAGTRSNYISTATTPKEKNSDLQTHFYTRHRPKSPTFIKLKRWLWFANRPNIIVRYAVTITSETNRLSILSVTPFYNYSPVQNTVPLKKIYWEYNLLLTINVMFSRYIWMVSVAGYYSSNAIKNDLRAIFLTFSFISHTGSKVLVMSSQWQYHPWFHRFICSCIVIKSKVH